MQFFRALAPHSLVYPEMRCLFRGDRYHDTDTTQTAPLSPALRGVGTNTEAHNACTERNRSGPPREHAASCDRASHGIHASPSAQSYE